MTLYKNRYRNESIRCPSWDYSSNGYYFVTICTRDRHCFFGQVAIGQMQLSPVGEIAHRFWYEIPNRFPHIALDQFVVMPNHIHGIIVINSPDMNICKEISGRDTIHPGGDTIHPGGDTIHPGGDTIHPGGDAINRVPAPNIPAHRGGVTGEHNPMLSSHSLGKIIRWYKGRCTFEIRSIETCAIAPEFAWQSRFHDYVIRDKLTLTRIRNYIVRNPGKWKGDRIRQVEGEKRD